MEISRIVVCHSTVSRYYKLKYKTGNESMEIKEGLGHVDREEWERFRNRGRQRGQYGATHTQFHTLYYRKRTHSRWLSSQWHTRRRALATHVLEKKRIHHDSEECRSCQRDQTGRGGQIQCRNKRIACTRGHIRLMIRVARPPHGRFAHAHCRRSESVHRPCEDHPLACALRVIASPSACKREIASGTRLQSEIDRLPTRKPHSIAYATG